MWSAMPPACFHGGRHLKGLVDGKNCNKHDSVKIKLAHCHPLRCMVCWRSLYSFCGSLYLAILLHAGEPDVLLHVRQESCSRVNLNFLTVLD